MRILLTAFEPFGLVRSGLMNRNASKEVMSIIRADYKPHYVDYEVLKVGKEGEGRLRHLLHELSPDGVIAMGESLMQSGAHIHIEPFAIDAPVSHFTMPGISQVIPSAFAEEAIKDFGQSHSSSIGHYYCNSAYKCVLEWCEDHGKRPAVFLHIPVFGNRKIHAKEANRVIQLMKHSP